MADLYALSNDEHLFLKEFIRVQRDRPLIGSNRQEEPLAKQAPETYIAYIPTGGIPARSGTTLGYRDCTIYKEIDGLLIPSGLPEQTVYNLSTKVVSGSQYVPTTRDKFGTWLVSGACITCTDSDSGTGTGTGTGTDTPGTGTGTGGSGTLANQCECTGTLIPTTLYATFTSVPGGPCNCLLTQTVTLIHDGVDRWCGSRSIVPGCFPDSGKDILYMKLQCDGAGPNTFKFDLSNSSNICSGPGGGGVSVSDCSPFMGTTTISGGISGIAGCTINGIQTATVTITE